MVGKGQPIRFDASESYDDDGEIVAWYWDFGDGMSDEGEYVEHIYEYAGSSGWKPKVVLTVVDDDGAENSTVHEVQVVGCDTCG
jgi:microbial collagenase